ncbi:MAG: NADPH-dependent aldehyde reductase Ahr [Lysobacteraceae bacterium]
MTTHRAWAASKAGGPLETIEVDPGRLGDHEVEVAVEHCGICHSDLSMLDNDWGMTAFPFVGGHEAVGTVTALGSAVRGLTVGQRVGVGWNAGSCGHCRACHGGDAHLCGSVQPTIVRRHGAFAERVRADATWAVPLPEGLDPAAAGPLMCGGITVFAPLLELGVRPTDRVGVIGIGGLGHLAVQFARAWGCEVTAFTSTEAKHEEARRLGAHHVVASNDARAIEGIAGRLDLIIDTVNVPLAWDAVIAALAPKGRLHVVGAVLEPIPVQAFSLISGQKSISGSPTGSREAIVAMLEFAARHGIAPQVERYPVDRINEAIDHLRAGRARYRVVLDVA